MAATSPSLIIYSSDRPNLSYNYEGEIEIDAENAIAVADQALTDRSVFFIDFVLCFSNSLQSD